MSSAPPQKLGKIDMATTIVLSQSTSLERKPSPSINGNGNGRGPGEPVYEPHATSELEPRGHPAQRLSHVYFLRDVLDCGSFYHVGARSGIALGPFDGLGFDSPSACLIPEYSHSTRQQSDY